jgi:hypothetical protein
VMIFIGMTPAAPSLYEVPVPALDPTQHQTGGAAPLPSTQLR